MNGINPYWPYWLSNTLNFTYHGKEVWGTIMKFGNDFVTNKERAMDGRY